MTRTGYTIADVGGTLAWASLRHFVENLDEDSRLFASLHPDEAERATWQRPSRVPWVLADLVDEIRILQFMFATAHNKKGHHAQRPKPYQRPGMSDEELGIRRIGKDPIPASQFDDWWHAHGKDKRE